MGKMTPLDIPDQEYCKLLAKVIQFLNFNWLWLSQVYQVVNHPQIKQKFRALVLLFLETNFYVLLIGQFVLSDYLSVVVGKSSKNKNNLARD